MSRIGESQLPTDEEAFVRLPAMQTERAANLARELYRLLSQRVLGRQVDLGMLRLLADQLSQRTSIGQAYAVAASLDDLTQAPRVTRKLLRRCCWRLAANAASLRRGSPVPHAVDVVPKHWVAAKLSGAGMVASRGKAKPKFRIGIRILTGPTAGRYLVQDFPYRFDGYLYGRLSGRPRRVQYLGPRTMIGLALAVELTGVDSELEILRIGVTRSQRAANVKLLRLRQRELHACPHQFKVNCIYCRVGRNECPRSTNPQATLFFPMTPVLPSS